MEGELGGVGRVVLSFKGARTAGVGSWSDELRRSRSLKFGRANSISRHNINTII